MTTQEETSMKAEGLEQTREAWDKIADGYDRFVTPTHMRLAEQGLRRAGLERGQRFLDVACGSGALSITAARLGAQVTGVDLSPVMVERLEARARREGFSGLEGRVMDGQDLEFDDAAFDVAGSQFGVMLFPDLPRGLEEMVRVTRPGGRVLVNVFGPPEQVEFLAFFLTAIRSVVPGFTPPPLDEPGSPMQASDPRVFRERLLEAGLEDVRLETVTERLRFSSGQETWDWLTNSNPVTGMLLARLSRKQQEEARAALGRLVRERAGGAGPAVLTNPVHIGVGTV